MSWRLEGTISGCGRSAGAVIPALGSGRYSPGPHIGLPSWRKGSDPHFTLNVFWGQPGALATVSDILDFSKIEAGKFELDLIDFDLRETVEDVVEMLAERAHSKGLELACMIDEDMRADWHGDPVRLRQI